MARIRTIKPGFWKHEDLSALPAETHMLAAALLNYADDEGYFNANPALVKTECLPLRELSGNIPGMLEELNGIGFIEVGRSADGKRYGRIVTFSEHQVISHKNASKIKTKEIVWERSGNVTGTLQEASFPEGNKEREEEGKNNGRSASPRRPVCVRNDLEGFDRFWAIWPNKTKRPAAEKAWSKAAAGAQAAAGSVDAILAGVERYKRAKPDWQSWPHPATWLNNRQWEDEGLVDAAPTITDAERAQRRAEHERLEKCTICCGKGMVMLRYGARHGATAGCDVATRCRHDAAALRAFCASDGFEWPGDPEKAAPKPPAPRQPPMLLPIEGGAPPKVEAPSAKTAPDPLDIPMFLQRKAR